MRSRLGVLALCLLLGLSAGGASAQTTDTTTTPSPPPAPALDLSAKPVTEVQSDQPAAQPDPGDVPEVKAPGSGEPAPEQDPRIASGSGSAQLQSEPAKRREAQAACNAHPLPVSSMLGLPGTIGGDDTSLWGAAHRARDLRGIAGVRHLGPPAPPRLVGAP